MPGARRAKLKQRDWKLRIDDVLEALERIQGYIAGLTREQFIDDRRTIDAVARNMEIIGEAVHYIPKKVKKRHQRVPWDKMRDLRNYLAHEYFGVDDHLVWETATRNLPPLRPALERVLESEEERQQRRG